MRFSMIKIVGAGQANGMYEYEATSMEMAGSTPWKKTFDSRHELVSVMNGIFATQKRQQDVRRVMSKILQGGQYFFDVELTDKQAESLGWQRSPEMNSVRGGN